MQELRVTPIRHGTVIDHIPAGRALAVLKALRLPRPGLTSTVSVVMHVTSKAGGDKDIVKLEDRELTREESGVLAILAPGATVNTISNFAVTDKRAVEAPGEVRGHFQCPEAACITRREREPGRFEVNDDGSLTCAYCGGRGDPLALLV